MTDDAVSAAYERLLSRCGDEANDEVLRMFKVGDVRLLLSTTPRAAASVGQREVVARHLSDLPVRTEITNVGWKLVPVEPTEKMASAGADELFESVGQDWNEDARRIWSAMLTAAPTPPDVLQAETTIYIQLSDDGRHICKWDWKPFIGSTAYGKGERMPDVAILAAFEAGVEHGRSSPSDVAS